MLYHHPFAPPIPPQLRTIKPQVYPNPRHGRLSISSVPAFSTSSTLPPTVISVSHLSSATRFYATLLRPISIKLIQAFNDPHPVHNLAYYSQSPNSIFGFTQLYPPQTILILIPTVPHTLHRPEHVILTAPSQRALHEFCAHSKYLLPHPGGRVELTEYGERYCMKDLDGNLIEVQWSAHNSGMNGNHGFSDRPTKLPQFSRSNETKLVMSSHRKRDKEKERERRGVKSLKDKRKDVRIPHHTKNESAFGHDIPRERTRMKKANRVIKWQKDVADSINVQDHDSLYEFDHDSEDLSSSESNQLALTYAKSYSSSEADYGAFPKSKLLARYRNTYQLHNAYQLSNGDDDENKESHSYRYKIKRWKDFDSTGESDDDSTTDQLEHRYRNKTRSFQIKHRPSSFAGIAGTHLARGRHDPYFESLSPPRGSRERHSYFLQKLASNSSEKCNLRNQGEQKVNSNYNMLSDSGYRDSFEETSALSSIEKDFKELGKRYGKNHRDMKINPNRSALKKRRERNLQLITRESSSPHRVYNYSNKRKGKEREKMNDSDTDYQGLSHYSLSETEDEDSLSHSSESKIENRPESSALARKREEKKERRRRWIEECHHVKDFYRKQMSRERTARYKQKSQQKFSRYYSPVLSAVHQCPSSVSGSTMRDEKHILARVPQPPTALPVRNRRRSGEIFVDENYDDYDENSNEYDETSFDVYNQSTAVKRPYRQAASRHPSQLDLDMNQRRRGRSSNNRTRHKRETLPMGTYSMHDYNPRYTSGNSASSFENYLERPKPKVERRISRKR